MSSPNTPSTASYFIFSSGHRVAVIVTGVIGSVSTVSVSLLLLHLLAVSCISGRTNANKDERIFLRMHLGAFVVCLLLSDLIQGISGIFQLVWATDRGIYDGPLCTAQAAMLLFGDNGTAFWNAVIGVHTFWTVVLGRRMSTVAVAFLIATGWTLNVILTVIGPLAIQTPERGPFYSIAGAWCFVTTEYRMARIYIHYVPMLLSAFIITVLYLLVAMVLFGVLVVDHNGWRLKAPPRRSGNGLRDFFGQFSWGRLVRPPVPFSSSQPSSGGNRSNHNRAGSIKLGSISKAEEVSSAVVDISAARADDGRIVEPERGRPSTAKTAEINEAKPKHGVQTHVSIEPSIHPNGQSMQLRNLAIKMLWYPIVYIALILPIAISRVDSNVAVSLSVMLGFMCLLWLMGTANTIIYVCTRRLGPTPWSRRNRSISRTRSISTRDGGAGQGVQSVQIYVDRHTHRATDDQFLDRTRHKSLAAESDLSSPHSASPTRKEFMIGEKRQSSSRGSTPPTSYHPTSPARVAAPPLPPPPIPFQQPQDSNDSHPPYRLYFYEDNDSVRTHSRKNSALG